MTKKFSILKYKKIIMLALILIAIAIIIPAIYITDYNVNKVTREEVLTQDMSAKDFKSSDEFLKNFDEFKIYLSNEIEAKFHDGELFEKGEREFTVQMKESEDSKITSEYIKITLGMGANWVKYISETTSSNVKGTKQTITFNNIDVLFPLKGDLLFLPKVEPTLYVLVEWSELGDNYYTYLEYDYSVYSVVPTN